MTIAALNYFTDELSEIARETRTDSSLVKLNHCIQHRWPAERHNVETELKPFYTFRNELIVQNDIIFKTNIRPFTMQRKMLNKLHCSQLGLIRCKQLARDYVFWLSLDSQLTDKISRYQICHSCRSLPHKEPLNNHTIIDIPFYKIGVDLFKCEGKVYVLIIDYYSKYPEVIQLEGISSKDVIETMKCFSRHGNPKNCNI